MVKEGKCKAIININCRTIKTNEPHLDFDATGQNCKATIINKNCKGRNMKVDNIALW